MNKCRNEELGKLLGAYELGMLEEADRTAFELHLFECDFCCRSYNEHIKTAQHIQYNAAVRDDIKKAAESGSRPIIGKAAVAGRAIPWWRRRLVVVPSLALAAALIFLILRPWHLEFRRGEEAQAAENRLAIVDFANMTEPTDSLRLGAIVSYLLISNLSEVPTIGLVSSERTKDILRAMGKKSSDIADAASASDFAKTAGVRGILYGSLIDQDNKITLTTQLTDIIADRVIGGRRVSSEPGEDIFSLVDRLTELTQKDLSLPMRRDRGADGIGMRVTTRSPEAYRYYLEGLDYINKLYYDEAARCFEKALSYDSTFAMAYYYLSEKQNPQLIWQAGKYADKASELERLYINARILSTIENYDSAAVILNQLLEKYPDEKYAYYSLGNLELNLYNNNKAIENYNAAIKIDSSYKVAYNQLMYAYDRVGNFEMALWAINKYIQLAPDEANPYDSRAELYLNNGFSEKALESYRQALAIKPDYYNSFERMGHIYRELGDYKKADSCLELVCAAPSLPTRFQGIIDRALIPYGQGRIDSSFKILDQFLEQNNIEENSAIANTIHFIKSFIYQGARDYNKALEEWQKGNDGVAKITGERTTLHDDFHIQLLAQAGQLEAALGVAGEVKTNCEREGKPLYDYWYGMAAIYYAQGEMDSCISYLKLVVADDKPYRCFAPRYWLGRAYLESGRPAEAIDELEKQRDKIDCLYLNFSIWKTEIHYYLGIAYEKSNWTDKAIQEYRRFIDIFKDADPKLLADYDVWERLARLEQKP